MKLETMKPETLRTLQKLTDMFTENTGAHFLDSGGAYGRNWERNQGLTVEAFLSLEDARWERDWGITVDSWHYLKERLTYTKAAEVLTRLMNVWESQDFDNRNPWSLSDQEDYLTQLGATLGNGWNSYNWENFLSQTLQGYDFTLYERQFVLLQVHGGCDVRGGYTRPVIFEACCECWLHDCYSAELYCKTCSHEVGSWSVRNNEFINYDGEWIGRDLERQLMETGCLNCNGDLMASMPWHECY
jgi:hypothetical protein